MIPQIPVDPEKSAASEARRLESEIRSELRATVCYAASVDRDRLVNELALKIDYGVRKGRIVEYEEVEEAVEQVLKSFSA